MKKLKSAMLLGLFIIGVSFSAIANEDDELLVLSKIMEIERLQEIILEQGQPLVTNGLINENVEIFIENQALQLQEKLSDNNDTEQLVINRYDINSKNAKIRITKSDVKIKIKLVKELNEWKVRSYLIREGKSVSALLDW